MSKTKHPTKMVLLTETEHFVMLLYYLLLIQVPHTKILCSLPKLLQAKIIFGITFPEAVRRIFLNIFGVSDDDKCYSKKMP